MALAGTEQTDRKESGIDLVMKAQLLAKEANGQILQ